MSTIAGLVSLNESPERVAESFDLVFESLAHRAGSPERWQNHQCALGARVQLGLCDGLEKSHSVHAPTGCAIVFDGRLDNRDDLLAQLPDLHVGATLGSPVDALGTCSAGAGAASAAVAIASPAGPAAVISDADIVLHAYLHWAEDCAAKLLGDFAFAVWDPRTRSLYAARDPLGVRPFFYTANPDRLSFASEFKALLSLPGVTRTPDDFMVSEFLLWWSGFPDITHTFFRDINRLLPAHWLRWNAKGLELHRYWAIDPTRRIRYRHHCDYVEHFELIFKEAVKSRLRGLHRVGIFLSGGMDSSSVATAAGRCAASRDIVTYCTQIPDTNDESRIAELVANLAGFPLRHHAATIGSIIERFETYVCQQATPLVDLGAYNDNAMLDMAAADGCGAILTGDGGDEMFNFPWAYVADLVRQFRVRKLFRELGPYSEYDSRRPLEMLKLASPYIAPVTLIRIWKMAKWRTAPPWVSPDLARRTNLIRRLRWIRPRLLFDSVSADVDHDALTRGRRVLVDEHRDVQAAPFGTHFRYPFFDPRLLGYMLAVPWEEKVTNGRVKSFLRETPGLLPRQVADLREKANYAPYSRALVEAQNWSALKPLFYDPPPRTADFVNLHAARDVYRAFVLRRDGRHRLSFVGLTGLFLWLKNFG